MPWECFIESRIGNLYRIIGIDMNRPSVCEFILTFLGGDLCLMYVVAIGTWGFKFLCYLLLVLKFPSLLLLKDSLCFSISSAVLHCFSYWRLGSVAIGFRGKRYSHIFQLTLCLACLGGMAFRRV